MGWLEGAKYPRRERTAPPVHPGRILKNLFLDELGMSVTELAQRTGFGIGYIESIIAGHERVSNIFADALGRVFRTGPTVWLNLQQGFDEWLRVRDSLK